MKASAPLERADWPWLLSLLLAGCLTLGLFWVHAYRITGGQGGVPLDDAWIHFQFARNLARGDGLSFNPGQPTSGSTAPLWTLLLAGLYAIGGRFPTAGQVLSAGCLLAQLIATYLLGKQLTGSRWAAWLAGTITAINGRAVWAGLSALETCLFTALSLLAIKAHLEDRTQRRYRLRTAALFGIAALSRPEGYLLFGLAMADYLYGITFQTGEPWTRRWRRLPILPVLLFCVIVTPYLAFSLHSSGHLLPNTYHAKVDVRLLPGEGMRNSLSAAAQYLILDNPLLLPFVLFGLVMSLRRSALLCLWSAGLPLVYAVLQAPLYQHGRYLMPLIPLNAILGTMGVLEARSYVRQRGWRLGSAGAGVAMIAGALIICATAWRLPALTAGYAQNVSDINEMHVTVGHWVVEQTPQDALLALNDIGAITYISERPVMDLAGLVSPEVLPILRAPDREARLADLMAENQVQYVIIFPNWFPELAGRQDTLEEVHTVTLERRTITGGETMKVYRTHWHE